MVIGVFFEGYSLIFCIGSGLFLILIHSLVITENSAPLDPEDNDMDEEGRNHISSVREEYKQTNNDTFSEAETII